MSNHLSELLLNVLKTYDIPVTYRAVEQTLKTHPEYPSMQSISDALDSWKVKHVVLRLSLEKLRALDVPVISCLEKEAHMLKRGEYIWITQVTDSKVYFLNASCKATVADRVHFEEAWSGVALAIDDITEAGEPDYKKARNEAIKEKLLTYAFAGGFIVLLTTLAFLSWGNEGVLSLLPMLLLLLVNGAGCCLSYILIRQEKNQSNRMVSKFCVAGAHIDCNKVAKSRYSKLFGLISWAEFGMAYFSAVILWLVMAPLSPNRLSPLWWLFLASLPFTVWSLFTQAFLIRKWCLFCCAIVVLLWINAGMLYFFLPFACVLPVVEAVLLALLILVCTAAVIYISKTSEPNDPYSGQRETAQIKYDFKTLRCHLSECGYDTAHTGLVWGTPQARHEITLYVSVACSPCGTAVKELRRLMHIYPDISCRIIFAVKSENMNDKANAMTRHLISLYKTLNQNDFFDRLDSWYAMPKKSLEALQKAFPVSSVQDCKADMEGLYHFSQQSKINYTPAILISGRLLSKLYSYQDLYGIARSLNAEE